MPRTCSGDRSELGRGGHHAQSQKTAPELMVTGDCGTNPLVRAIVGRAGIRTEDTRMDIRSGSSGPCPQLSSSPVPYLEQVR